MLRFIHSVHPANICWSFTVSQPAVHKYSLQTNLLLSSSHRSRPWHREVRWLTQGNQLVSGQDRIQSQDVCTRRCLCCLSGLLGSQSFSGYSFPQAVTFNRRIPTDQGARGIFWVVERRPPFRAAERESASGLSPSQAPLGSRLLSICLLPGSLGRDPRGNLFPLGLPTELGSLFLL